MSATVTILVQVELILEHAAAAKQLDGNALLPILTVSTPGWLLPDKASQGTFPGTMAESVPSAAAAKAVQQQTKAAEQPEKASPGFALSASKNRWLLPCKVAAQPSSTAMAELPQHVAAKQPGAALPKLNLIVSGNGWLLPNIASEGTCTECCSSSCSA